MDLKTYLKVSVINLLFLLVGLAVGIALTVGITGVHAQTNNKVQPSDSAPIKDVAATKVTLDPNAEYVSPGVTLGGPVVTNTILASRIACDRLEVNGFEPLKLNDAILSTLVKKGYLDSNDVKAIVNSGKAEHPLRTRPQ